MIFWRRLHEELRKNVQENFEETLQNKKLESSNQNIIVVNPQVPILPDCVCDIDD
jgi:hypothetical protein